MSTDTEIARLRAAADQRLDELITARGEIDFLCKQFATLSAWAKTLRGLDHYAAVLSARGPSAMQLRDEMLAKAGWERARAAEARARKTEAERDALREAARDVVSRLRREHRDEQNIPGHGHLIPGIWDESNGPPKGGTRCEDCAAWERLLALLNKEASR